MKLSYPVESGVLSRMVLVPSLYDKAFLRYFTLQLQKLGPRHDIMWTFGYVIPACLCHCGTV